MVKLTFYVLLTIKQDLARQKSNINVFYKNEI